MARAAPDADSQRQAAEIGDTHQPLVAGVIGSMASTVPQLAVDAGLAPCPGCKQVLSTVEDAAGSCEWLRHVLQCPAWRGCASGLRLPGGGPADFATPQEFCGWLRRQSSGGSQACVAATAGAVTQSSC